MSEHNKKKMLVAISKSKVMFSDVEFCLTSSSQRTASNSLESEKCEPDVSLKFTKIII